LLCMGNKDEGLNEHKWHNPPIQLTLILSLFSGVIYPIIFYIGSFGKHFEYLSLAMNIGYLMSILILSSYLINRDGSKLKKRNIQFRKIGFLFLTVIIFSVISIPYIFKPTMEVLGVSVFFSILFISISYVQVIHYRDFRRILVCQTKDHTDKKREKILVIISKMIDQMGISQCEWCINKKVVKSMYELRISLDVKDDISFTLNVKGEAVSSDKLMPIYLYHSKLPKNEEVQRFIMNIEKNIARKYEEFT